MLKIEKFTLLRKSLYIQFVEDVSISSVYAINKMGNEYYIPLIKTAPGQVTIFPLDRIPDYGMYGFLFVDDQGTEHQSIISDKAECELDNFQSKKWKFSDNPKFYLQSWRQSISTKLRDIVVLDKKFKDGILDIRIPKKVVISQPEVFIRKQQHEVNEEIKYGGLPVVVRNNHVLIDVRGIKLENNVKYYLFLKENGVYYRLYEPKMKVELNKANRYIEISENFGFANYFYSTVQNRLALVSIPVKRAHELDLKTIDYKSNLDAWNYMPQLDGEIKMTEVEDLNQIDSFRYKLQLKDNSIKFNHFFLVDLEKSQFVKVPFLQDDSNVLLNLKDIINLFKDYDSKLKLLGIGATKENLFNMTYFRLSSFINKPRYLRYYNAVNFNITDNNMATRFFINDNGVVSIHNKSKFATDNRERKIPLSFKIKNVKKNHGNLEVELSFSVQILANIKKIQVLEIYLYKTAFINEHHDFNVDGIDFSNKTIYTSCQISDLISHEEYGYYRIAIKLKVDDKIFDLRINNPEAELKEELAKGRVMYNHSNRSIFPSIEGNTLSFIADDIVDIDHKYDIYLENKYTKLYKQKKVVSEPNVFIIFEKETNYAQDNAFALFEWVQNNVPNNKMYYVIRKDSPQSKKLTKYANNVLYTGTKKYYEMVTRSHMLVSSDSPLHLVGNVNRRNASAFYKEVIMKKPFIMLQHGVTAMKSHAGNKPWNAASGMIDYFVVTNTIEQEVVHKSMGYDYSQLPILGFSRWNLFGRNTPVEKQFNNKIIYVPTWRQWLNKATDEEFIQSDYYEKINKLLNNKDLVDSLEKYDTDFYVYLHPFMQRLTHNLSSNNGRVHVLSSDDYDLGDLLRGGSLLISDYSSVVWDFAVQRKPVIFYQFDKARYLKKVGSLVDLDNLPIGRSFENDDDVVQQIKYYLAQNFKLDNIVSQNIDNIFGSEKQDYSRNIYNFINQVSKEYVHTMWSKK